LPFPECQTNSDDGEQAASVAAHVCGESGIVSFLLEERKSARNRSVVFFVPGLASKNQEYAPLAVEEGTSVAGTA
jgi:hypothetical protein